MLDMKIKTLKKLSRTNVVHLHLDLDNKYGFFFTRAGAEAALQIRLSIFSVKRHHIHIVLV